MVRNVGRDSQEEGGGGGPPIFLISQKQTNHQRRYVRQTDRSTVNKRLDRQNILEGV